MTKQKINLAKLDAILNKYKHDPGALIPILQETQAAYNHLSEEMLEHISKATEYKLSQVYGVVTFYSQFRLQPYGKHVIKVCHGTACYVGGATDIMHSLMDELGVEEGETTKNKKFTLESVACLGCCSLASVMMIDQKTYGRLSSKSAREVVRGYE